MASKNNLSLNLYQNCSARFIIILGMILYMLPGSSFATIQYQSMDSILATAKDFTLANLSNEDREQSVITGKLDKRLRLKACSDKLEAFFPEYGRRVGNISVGIRCSGEENWSLFVPISVKIFRNVVVAKRHLARGVIINKADLMVEKRNISAFASDYYTDFESIVGMQLSRPLQLGQSISSNSIKQPMAIKRGNLVTLIAKNQTFEVRMEGKAMTDAAVGNRVKVKNLRSNRIVEGIVKSDNMVQVH